MSNTTSELYRVAPPLTLVHLTIPTRFDPGPTRPPHPLDTAEHLVGGFDWFDVTAPSDDVLRAALLDGWHGLGMDTWHTTYAGMTDVGREAWEDHRVFSVRRGGRCVATLSLDTPVVVRCEGCEGRGWVSEQHDYATEQLGCPDCTGNGRTCIAPGYSRCDDPVKLATWYDEHGRYSVEGNSRGNLKAGTWDEGWVPVENLGVDPTPDGFRVHLWDDGAPMPLVFRLVDLGGAR